MTRSASLTTQGDLLLVFGNGQSPSTAGGEFLFQEATKWDGVTSSGNNFPFPAKKIESRKRYFLNYKTAICALLVYNIFGAPHQRNSGIQFKCQFWPLTGEGKSTEIAVSSSWDNICNSSPNLELGRASKEARDALCSVGTKIQGMFQHYPISKGNTKVHVSI